MASVVMTGAIFFHIFTPLGWHPTWQVANEAIKIYQADRNYPKFYRNFLTKSDNGRFSLRVANTFSLETTSIKLKNNGDDRVDSEGLLPITTVCLVR
jgi:hypothetical protein